MLWLLMPLLLFAQSENKDVTIVASGSGGTLEDAKLKADEKARWQFKMKQYADKISMQKEQVRIAEENGKRDDTNRENQPQRDAISREKQSSRNFELDKIRVNSYREVAVEQARNQPKTVTYNNIYWR